ncbi:hypothetical protein GP475_10685 [Corynebacterium poyangense]|uniref:Uncharacterized protein n=1 Tax=Corynebacterium poyangense TaxID=2684405 RepID=A0A7H0SR68_9CORY|nr:DUF6779 domain-containing protein [Corynebacterium poyangense]MBZ8176471.1 hypothetical protein [Corynebacterium poyangense]QNQ91043.1 hypothetical protein GP475_10685 [Corynebacterium poyangense]
MSAQSPDNEPKGSVDRGQILLILLIVLALIASLIMLITDSSGALKLALLASLWAAIIGFFLVTRYRRQAEASRRELEYARDLYHAEMECAEAEMEAEHERFAREYAEKQRDEHVAALEKIQDQLGQLRGHLESIAGQTFEYEPAALKAEARRVLEIEQDAARSTSSTWGDSAADRGEKVSVVNTPDQTSTKKASAKREETEAEAYEADVPEPKTEQPRRTPSADAVAGRIGQQPSHPIRYPWATGQPADKEHNPREKRAQHKKPAESAAKHAPKFSTQSPDSSSSGGGRRRKPEPRRSRQERNQAQHSAAGSKPSNDETATLSFNTGAFSAVKWDNNSQPGHHERPDTTAGADRGRRRADDRHQGSFTVAELLARAQEEKTKKRGDR